MFNTHLHWVDTLTFLNGDANPVWCSPIFQTAMAISMAIASSTIPGARSPSGSKMASSRTFFHSRRSGAPRSSTRPSSPPRTAMPCSKSGVVARKNRQPDDRVHPGSSTLRLIQDLVHALDTGEPTRGGVRIAEMNTQSSSAQLSRTGRMEARVSLLLTRFGALLLTA